MSTTLAAVFENYPDAQDASTKLQASGVDRQSIQLNGSSSMSTDTQAGLGSTSTSTSNDDEPGAISRFFSNLFGSDDSSGASTYSAAAERGHVVLTVMVADEDRVDDISDILNDCGAIDIDEKEQQSMTRDGSTSQTEAFMAASTPATQTRTSMPDTLSQPSRTSSMTGVGDNDTLQRVEENLQVGKRTVQKGGVRVHQRMVETPVEEQVTLRDERASIERKAVDRPATEAELQTAFKDQDFDIRETAEEAVVSKTAKVVEEIQVGKQATERVETVRETLRRTEIDVENTDSMATGKKQAYAGFERRMSNDPKYSGQERRMAA